MFVLGPGPWKRWSRSPEAPAVVISWVARGPSQRWGGVRKRREKKGERRESRGGKRRGRAEVEGEGKKGEKEERRGRRERAEKRT